MNISLRRISQTADFKVFGSQIVTCVGVKDTVDKDDLKTLDPVKHWLFLGIEQSRWRRLYAHKPCRLGELPIFIAARGHTLSLHTG